MNITYNQIFETSYKISSNRQQHTHLHTTYKKTYTAQNPQFLSIHQQNII